jgi:hypothetical protein
MITAGASGYRHGAIAHDAADMGRTSADGFRPIAPAEMEQKEPLAIPSAVTVISRSR